ncbi:hypothetical protein QBC46DRAFT_253130 [Diplogelasinospora grovesii]|uniref:JmjC domain-containing protein n=1 Tax=Diplogelasinospora grovesii TaxID=303347 RepID=A0AAN6S8R6_9PEZI|nr:hypothetical protein QBC46DRAFT_253130 [Diplogelasinospora grovesii]
MASMASPVDSVDHQLRQIGDALRDYLNNGTTATRKVKPPSSGAARDLLQRLLGRLEDVSSELSDSRKLAIPNAAFANRPDTPESPDGSSVVQQDAVSREDDDVLATTEHPPSTATAASPLLSVASQVSSALPSVSGRNSKRALARGMPFFPIQYQDMNVLNEDLYEEYSRHPATRERGYFKLQVAGLPPLAVENVEAPTRDHAISFRYKRDALGTVKVDTGKRLRFNPPSLPLPGSAKLEWSFEEQQKLWNESARNPPVGTRPYIIGNPLFPDVELSPGEKLRRRGRTNLEGINTQYIYWNLAGTTITTMHREDAHVRSENLLRSGEIKMWCFVKPKDSRALEKHMREEFRGMRHCSQSVRHLSRHIPPELLDKWGVEYTLDYCLPGQAMVTEPGTYHQVLNLGPNYALAINLEYNSSPDDPPRYRFCDRYCPDQTSVSAEDFQLYRGPNGTPLREVSAYEPDTPKEDARQRSKRRQLVQTFAGAESAPPGKTRTPVTDTTSPAGEISNTIAKAPTPAAAKTATPTAKTTKTTPRPRRSSKSTKAPAVVCKTITPVPLPPQYLHLRQLQQQQQKDAPPKRVPSPAPVMSAQTGNSATLSPSQQSPGLAPSVSQSSNELPLPTPQLPEGEPDQSNDLPERAPNAVRVARAVDPTKTASAKPRRRVADAPADKSRKKRRLEPRVPLQPTSPARSDKNALEHLATLVRTAEPGSCPLEDVDISGRTAFKRLDALVRGWRRHSSLFPPSTLTNTALFSHIESLNGDEALHVFLRRFAKMQMAAFSEKCHGDMDGPFADLNWDRCKLHDYIREGKCWRALCGDTDGLLCLMPPDLEYQDALYGEKVARLREQLKNQLAVRLCRIGEHLMLKIWCGARAPEYLWEDVEDASELSDKDLYDLILPYVPRTENYFDPDPTRYDWTVRPRGWRWAWPADPTLVLDPTARRCSMCHEDTCLCHANKVPKLPPICWDGSKGTGVRAGGAYRENDILGEAVGQLVPFGVYDEEWCLPIHRPDVGNRGTPLAEIYSAKEGNWVRKVRHNPEDPSAAFKMMKISGRWRNMLIAARDIEDGQEITAMYGKGYKRGDKPANCYSYIEGINTYIEILDDGDSDEDDG